MSVYVALAVMMLVIWTRLAFLAKSGIFYTLYFVILMLALVACFFTSPHPSTPPPRRTFNPADYSESMSADGCGTKLVVWEATQNGTDDRPGKWFCLFALFCFC